MRSIWRILIFLGLNAGLLACSATSQKPGELIVTPREQMTPTKITDHESVRRPELPITPTLTHQQFLGTLSPSPTLLPDLPKSSVDLTEYIIDVLFDYPQKRLRIKQETTFLVPAANLDAIPFIVYPATILNVFELGAVQINGFSPSKLTIEDGILWVFSERFLSAEQRVHISLEYDLHIPFRAAKLGYTYRQVNLGDWYPMLPMYDHERGWLIFPQSMVGENLVYPLAKYSVSLRLNQSPPNLQIAASSPVKFENDTYFFELNNGRNFSLSVSAEYEQISKMVGSTEIRSLYFPEHSREGAIVLDAAARAYETYSQFLGKINQKSLTIVEADFRDGMEFQGLFFLGKEYYDEYAGSPQSYLVSLSAHETAHQWFYAEVANNQAEEPWLDEAICTYLELMFYEKEYPDLTDWWWNYRVKRFSPAGWVNSTIYDHQSFRGYVDSVYLRGALYLDDLRSTLGDYAFEEFLKQYFINNQRGFATANDFFMHLPNEHHLNLENLFSVYFQSR